MKINFPLTKSVEAFIVDGKEYPESAFPNVARLFIGNSDHCTGTLIDSNHVITAAHCFFENKNNGIRNVSDTDMRVRLNGKYYQSKKVYIHPAYKNSVWGCIDGQIDAAIIELATNVPANVASPASLLTTPISTGAEIVIAGYGLVGTGTGGDSGDIGTTAPRLGKIYAGTTKVEGFGKTPLPVDNIYNSQYVYFTFDPGEANTAPGDSGGPAFYNKKLSSIACGGVRPFTEFDNISVQTRIDVIVPWINDVLAGKSDPGESFSTTPAALCIFYDAKFTRPIIVNVKKPITFTTTVEIPVNAICNPKIVPPEYYNFALEYTIVGKNDWKTIPIPDSSIPTIKAGLSSTGDKFINPIEFTPNITFDPTLTYEIRFAERYSTPDVKSEKILYGPVTLDMNVTSVTFDPTKKALDIKAVALFKNSSIPSSVKVSNFKFGYKIYDDKNEVVGGLGDEDIFSGEHPPNYDGNIFYYNKVKQINIYRLIWSDIITPNTAPPTPLLQPIYAGKTYKIVLREQVRGLVSKAFLFTIPGKSTGGNGGDVRPMSNDSENEIISTESTSFLAAEQQQFSGTSTTYNEISMNGSLTPTIEGDDLSIDGSLTYSYKTVPVNDINKGGKISVQLVDGDGNKSKIIPMNVVPAGEAIEYNKPYFFNHTFDNYRRFANENGTSVTTDRNGPFTLNITNDTLGIKITDIPVVDVVISGGMEAFNEGGGMAPESENNDPNDTVNDPALLNNVNNPSDGIETKKGLLRNPLRKGLDSIPEIVSALVKNIVIPIAIPFLALSIIYTGFLFIQARGNKDKLEKAKEALKWTLIGGAIILASYVIATALQGTIADIIR